jgi:ATP-dependent helicase/nuclease subunit A
LLELARQFDPFQRQGLYRFLRFVQSQADEEMDLPPASPPVGDAVRLLSVHKSKGLEFPVVVLAGMGTRFNEQDLSGPVLLHETLGLCPKITPPDADQSYPGLTHWLARRSEQRELRGEELRLLYVALTRARDALILVGTTNRKADGARWEPVGPTDIGTDEVAEARSHLDWLRAWLMRGANAGHWQSERQGETHLLRWQIYDGSGMEFAAPENTFGAERSDIIMPPDAARVEALKTRLAWEYAFAAATRRVAKTSVTALRGAAEEADAEAEHQFFDPPALGRTLVRRGALSAAEIGIAHHKFLQHFDLAGAADAEGLRREADRLEQHGILSSAETGALDFAALAGFWNSELGGKIRAAGGQVRRELPFTARCSPAELAAITGEESAGLAGEFVIVQGVADLAVLGAEEIWLVDFKTDEISPAELPAKVKNYSTQLKLYAMALAGIFQRPVTAAWLHFLAPQKSVRVELGTPESG